MYVAARIVSDFTCFPVIVQWGRTPLYIASKSGHDIVVEVLLKAGADVNLADEVSY